VTTSGSAGLRPLPLETIGRLLIGYGVVGVIAAILGAVLLVIGLARVNGLADRVGGDFGGVTAVLDRTATVLDSAVTTTRGFGSTVDSSTSALTTAAGDLWAIVPRLRDLETQANEPSASWDRSRSLRSAACSGRSPASSATSTRDWTPSRRPSRRTARRSMRTPPRSPLATETRTLSARLGGGALTAAIDDARWLIVALLGVAAIGALVPAVGALAAGLWLRRWLRGEPISP